MARDAGVRQARELVHSAEAAKDDKALKRVSGEFESLLVNQMLQTMRKAVPKFDPLHSYAEETYQEMLDREWTKNMTKHKSMGLSDLIYRQLSRLQTDQTQTRTQQ